MLIIGTGNKKGLEVDSLPLKRDSGAALGTEPGMHFSARVEWTLGLHSYFRQKQIFLQGPQAIHLLNTTQHVFAGL